MADKAVSHAKKIVGGKAKVVADAFSVVKAKDIDIVVELMGGLQPAGDLIRRSLLAGKSVVTANKQLLSLHGAELMALARAQKRELLFEASVAVQLTVVSPMAKVLPEAGAQVTTGLASALSVAVAAKVTALPEAPSGAL